MISKRSFLLDTFFPIFPTFQLIWNFEMSNSETFYLVAKAELRNLFIEDISNCISRRAGGKVVADAYAVYIGWRSSFFSFLILANALEFSLASYVVPFPVLSSTHLSIFYY
jgi:hypothetical protein